MTDREQLLNQLNEVKKALKNYDNDNKYSNGKIYKIICDDKTKIYIGSTITPLKTRLSKHKNCYKRYCNGKDKYHKAFDIFEIGNARIELIEEFPCKTKIELLDRERYWCKELKSINKKLPGRTNKLYYQDNKESISKHKKDRYRNNKKVQESDKMRTKKWYQNNKDKATEYHKQYREKHREEKKKYFKEYYQKNNNKIECDICGRSVGSMVMARHKKSKFHLDSLP